MPKGTINGEPYEVPNGWTIISDAGYRKSGRALGLLADLNRSPHGRHQGDAEFQDPTGISQGNPLLSTGQVIGHTLYGCKIVVPDPGQRHDPDAWVRADTEETTG